MSDSLQEVRALPDEALRHTEQLQLLKGVARTPERPEGELARERHMTEAGEAELEPGRGAAAGGTHPRGPVQRYSAVEIAERAAKSAPGAVAFARQFGAHSVGTSGYPAQRREPKEHPRRGQRGNPGGDQS